MMWNREKKRMLRSCKRVEMPISKKTDEIESRGKG